MHNDIQKKIIDFIESLFNTNKNYSLERGQKYFKNFAQQQNPQATIVMCSDSRIQTEVYASDAVNHLFLIRNIGNQIITCAGSVEYGIRILKTPLLIIIGHSGCGAIEALVNEMDIKSVAIKKELTTLKNVKGDLNEAIINNIHEQVNVALSMFQDLVQPKNLVIIGLTYDFRNDYNHGYGRLLLTNVNGKLNLSEMLSEFKEIFGVDINNENICNLVKSAK